MSRLFGKAGKVINSRFHYTSFDLFCSGFNLLINTCINFKYSIIFNIFNREVQKNIFICYNSTKLLIRKEYIMLTKGNLASKGKIIRDAVHGDIFIPERFIRIIDAPEFQRLRRIKQLSVANTVFPSADHTRFSHSIGCFYVMKKMVEHFESFFKDLKIAISREEKDTALLAALLHDIGHGPFSHAYEYIHPDPQKNISHEDWTTRIITDKNSQIYIRIVENFGKRIPQKVANHIQIQRDIKNKEQKKFEIEKVDLSSVLSSLISSQLDADRIDYLVRDSFHAGVTFGKIDISRIISSLAVTVYQDKYYVCIPEKYMEDIESYLLARYHMQKVVYYHEFKVQMEQIIKKIFRKAYDLNKKNELDFCPSAIKKVFSSEELSVQDYIDLDDSTFICAFQEWSKSKDKTLSALCRTALFRDKAKRIEALDNSIEAYTSFKKDVCALFSAYDYPITEEEINNQFFWVEKIDKFSAYKVNKENIWIQRSNGVVIDLSQVSKIIMREEKKDKETPVFLTEQDVVYIDFAVLKLLPICDIDGLIKNLEQIISNYDIRKTIEIEKKYSFDNQELFKEVLKYLKKRKYILDEGEAKEQIDTYYDTNDFSLMNHHSTLRIRQKDGYNELTIKKPTPNSFYIDGQNERFEYQCKVENRNLSMHEKFIKQHLDCISDVNMLQPNVTIRNLRTPTIITQGNAKFEMVFDCVKYCSGEKEIEDYQIEIELKSNYIHRINLKVLSDEIEKNVSGLTSLKESKYERGLKLTGVVDKNY